MKKRKTLLNEGSSQSDYLLSGKISCLERGCGSVANSDHQSAALVALPKVRTPHLDWFGGSAASLIKLLAQC